MDKAIKDLDIYISDGNYSSKYPRSEEFVDKGIPFIRGNNMVDGDITDEDMYHITPEKHNILLKGHVKSGDVLIITRGNIGQVAIVPDRHENSNINAQIVLLRTNQDKLYNRYLLWALQSKLVQKQFYALQTGTALKQLPVGKLEQVKIRISDIEEQHKISDNLDEIFRVIKLRQKEICLLDNLIKVRFSELFGECDDWIPLDKLTERITDGSHNPPKGVEKSDYLMLSSQNIYDNLVLDDVRYLTKEDFECENKRTNIEEGDVLLTIVGTVGRTHVVKSGERFVFQRSVGVIKPTKGLLDGTFLSIYIGTHKAKEQLESCAHGSSQKGIYIKDIKQLKIPVVDYEKQIEFATFVKQVEKSKVEIQKALDKTKILFNSLMQQYFG